MNAYYFRKDKIAVLGAIKAQLPFSGGKYQLLFSWYEIPFPTIFYRLNFQLPHPNRSNSVSSQKYPLKGNERIRESRKLHSKPFTYFFSLGAPVLLPESEVKIVFLFSKKVQKKVSSSSGDQLFARCFANLRT